MTAAPNRRRWLRRLGGMLAALVLVVAALAAISQTAAFRDWLRRQVVARVNAAMAGRIAIGRLDGNLFGRLAATDLRLTLDGRRVAAIRRVEATYDVLALARGGGLVIRTLDADGVALQVVEDERGWNVARLTTASPATASERSLAIALAAVRITHAAVRIVRPDRAWRLRDATLIGSAHVGADATRIAIDALTVAELGSGLRVLEGTGRVATTPDGRLSADDVHVRTVGSVADGAAAIGPAGARDVDARLAIGRLAAAELQALLGKQAPTSDLMGDLRAVGPPRAVAVHGELRARAGADADVHEVGTVRVDGTVDVGADVPGGDLQLVLDHVDARGIAGARLPDTDLTGDVHLSSPPAMPRTATVAVDLREPRVAATSLTRLTARGSGDAETVTFEADATAGDGRARAAGTVLPKRERVDVTLTATDLDPAPLAGRSELAGRLNGTLTVNGEGFAVATARGTAVLALAPSRLGDVAIGAADVALRADADRLVVERARLVTDAATANVSGEAARAADGTLGAGSAQGELRVADAHALAGLAGQPAIGGAGTVTFDARGTPRAFAAQATVAGRNLSGAGWRAAGLDAQVTGQRLGSTEARAELHAHGRDVGVGARTLTAVDLGVRFAGDATRGRADVDLHGRETDAEHQLTATVAFDPAEQRLTIAKLRVDDRGDHWTTTGTPVIVRRAGRVTVQDFAVASARGTLGIAGVVGEEGPSDLTLTTSGLDVQTLRGLVPEDVSGRLAGRAHLGGTLAAPRLDADVGVDAPTLGGVRYHELQLRIGAAPGRGELHARLVQTGDQALIADAALPLAFALRPWRLAVTGNVDGRVRAQDVDLAFVSALLPGLVANAGGTLRADVAVGGPFAALEARGRIAIVGGRARVLPLGVRYDPIELALDLEGRTASIDRLSIVSGKGTLSGGGDARLGSDGASMDARFEAKTFPLFANEYGHGAASGWVWISGTLAAPVLEGSLTTDGLVLQIPEVLPQAARKPDATITVVGPGAPPPEQGPDAKQPPLPPVPSIVERAAVTIQVSIPKDAWLRRSDANIELQGWMTLWKKPTDETHLAGDIRGVRGWYAFQGKKFTLAEADVLFSGQGFDPVLDVVATHQAGDYLVRLHVAGTMTKPTLTLESEPALDQADVLSVLLFGAPANKLSEEQSAGLREQAVGIAGGYVASELRQSVANALGVDDLQLDTGTTGLQDAKVSVGKYVAKDIFVSLAHRFGTQGGEEVRVEYRFRPNWSLETNTDTFGKSGVDLFWKRRY